jgi:hypothetical protein
MQQWSPTSRLRQHSDGAGRCGPPVGVGSGLQARASGRPVLWASKRQALAVSFPFSYGSSFHYHSNFFFIFLSFFLRCVSILFFIFHSVFYSLFSCSQISSMGSSSWCKNYNIETKKVVWCPYVQICVGSCMHGLCGIEDITFVTVFLQVFKHVSSVLSIFFCILQVLHLNVSKVYLASTADFHLVGFGECSGFRFGQCGSDFRRCVLHPWRLVAAGRPHPCSSGQWQLEAALGWCRAVRASRGCGKRTTGTSVRTPRPPHPGARRSQYHFLFFLWQLLPLPF